MLFSPNVDIPDISSYGCEPCVSVLSACKYLTTSQRSEDQMSVVCKCFNESSSLKLILMSTCQPKAKFRSIGLDFVFELGLDNNNILFLK